MPFFSISILAELHKRKTLSPPLYAIDRLAILDDYDPLMENSAFKVWLYYLGNQLFLFLSRNLLLARDQKEAPSTEQTLFKTVDDHQSLL